MAVGGLSCGRIAMNTSSSEYFEFDLAGHILRRLEDSGLPASCLGVEITETVIVDRSHPPIKVTLERLRQAGVQIALDDFGTGYASLTHLHGYSIDVVKIDRSFVQGLPGDATSRAIVSAVLGLGRSLGIAVVAEGVETEEQAALLRAGGCGQGQGYLFSPSIPASRVADFIREMASAPSERLAG